MHPVSTQDLRVETAAGQLFARRWDPHPRSSVVAPVVLFHDSLGCVDLWREFPMQLASATGRSVIAYDRLGFGKSDPHPSILSGGFIHDEACTGFRFLRESLQLETFVAFGHSVGGGMAVACAAVHGEGCLALITESAQAFVEDRTVNGILDAKEAFAQPGRIDRLKKHHGDKAAWVLSAWVDTWLAPEFANWSLDDDLRSVHCPVLAIHGDCDEYGSVRHPERIAELTSGRSIILRGCGHVPHREEEQSVLDIVQQWLRLAG